MRNNSNRKLKNKPLNSIDTSAADKKKIVFILISIVIITFILFSKSSKFFFVTWDDPQYIINNDIIKNFSFNGIVNIFTHPVLGMYNPITILLYSLVYKFFGLNPNAYHLLNLSLHVFASLMSFFFIYKLTKRFETAGIVAVLFALHPMHASVALWISQTKTSLCAIFFFAALINYLKYLKDKYNAKYYIYVIAFFVLALLSKPNAVTLAPLLFLLDYYLTREIDKRMFLEKIPMFVLAICFGVLTVLTHAMEGDSIFNINQGYSFLNNILIANYSVVFYLEKLFLPLNLSAIYPYPENSLILPLKYYFSILAFPTIILIVYKARSFRKELIFGLLFFIITISVLLRIVPSGAFMASNQYSYISYTGFFFIAGQFISYMLDNKFKYLGRYKVELVVSLFLVIAFFTYRTSVRITRWENSITLFDDVISKYPKLMDAYTNRGFAKEQMGDKNGAYVDYNTAIDLNPNALQTLFNRALLEINMEKDDEAIDDFTKIIELKPDYGYAYLYRGIINEKRNQTKQALDDFETAELLGIDEASKHKASLKSDSIENIVDTTKSK